MSLIFINSSDSPFQGLANNFPPSIRIDGRLWSTVEHFYQAQKFEDLEVRERIALAETPEIAWSLGQSRDHPIKHNWDAIREEVMKNGLRAKFSHREPRDLLLSTGDSILVNSYEYDFYWAAGMDGTGLDRLSEILMQIRRTLRGVA